MSESQDELILRQRQLQRLAQQKTAQQRQVQQRQILAMMGIGQWVQPDSATLNIAEISNSTDLDDVADSAQPVQSLVEESKFEATIGHVPVNLAAPTQPVVTATLDDKSFSQPVSPDAAFTGITPTVANLVEPLIEKVITPADYNNIDADDNDKNKNSLNKVVPFDLQGGRYGNWVLMVDIQALNSDSQKLWQNIIQALSLDCETTSFPICAGMDTAELANASLAGYIFKIGRSEEIQVAALTELPDGLTHPNFVSVATLEAMLVDSSLKRQLWQQISNQD